jgi:hypothetical protein
MERPTSVLVLGVLNLLFAGLGLLGMAGWVFVLLGMSTSNPVYSLIQQSAPYRMFLCVSIPLGLVFTGALALGGAGLLLSKPWGRTSTLLYAVYALLTGLLGVAVSAVHLVGPLLEQASNNPGPQIIAAAGGALGGLAGTCLGLLYPVVLLRFMFREDVAEYFARVKLTTRSR